MGNECTKHCQNFTGYVTNKTDPCIQDVRRRIKNVQTVWNFVE
jgi:hypothetical protein